jgi:mRNA interferase RelE/StbE
MEYKITIKATAKKELEKIPKSIRIHLIEAINNLSIDPRPAGCKKLVNFDNSYRVRHGDYRIVYQIVDKELSITIIKVGHRRDIYR